MIFSRLQTKKTVEVSLDDPMYHRNELQKDRLQIHLIISYHEAIKPRGILVLILVLHDCLNIGHLRENVKDYLSRSRP